MKRREFLKIIGGLLGGLAMSPYFDIAGAALSGKAAIPRKRFGRTGAEVSIIGLGGFNISLNNFNDATAADFVRYAIDGGINFLDNAREYNNGLSEERMGRALLNGYRTKAFLMTKNCDHSRSFEGSIKSLERSLRAFKTDFIDLILFHEINYADDVEYIVKKGALEAMIKAREQGKVRFIGFTGHKDPRLHLKMLEIPFEWDAVMLPVGVMDYHRKSFTRTVLPELLKRGTGIIGFKSMGGFMSGVPQKIGYSNADCLRYSLSQHAHTVVVGMELIDQLCENISIAASFVPMSADEQSEMRMRTAGFADDIRTEVYKNTPDYDSALGKELHNIK